MQLRSFPRRTSPFSVFVSALNVSASARQVAFNGYTSAIHVLSLLRGEGWGEVG